MNFLTLLLCSGLTAVALGHDPYIEQFTDCPRGPGGPPPPPTQCDAMGYKCYNIECKRCVDGVGVPGLCNGPKQYCCVHKCEDGWEYFQGFCYKLITQALKWHGADANCKALNAELVSIHSQAEQNFVDGLHTAAVWIGLCDKVAENTWVWSDGTAYGPFNNWHGGEPNDFTPGEDCVENTTWTPPGFTKWNDLFCTVEQQSICKKPVA